MKLIRRVISYLFAIFLIVFLLSFIVLIIAFLQRSKNQSYLLVNKNPDELEDLYFLDIQQENNNIVLVKIDAKVETRLSGGYGEYTLQALYPLLKLDEKSEEEIRANFAQATMLPVGEVISFPDLNLLKDKSYPSLLWQLSKQVDSLVERWCLLRFFLRIPFFNSSTVSVKEYLSDYSQDRLRCTVAIINSTQSSGLAAYFATIYEANQYRVVRVDSDTKQALESSEIYVAQSDAACNQEAVIAARFLPHSQIKENELLGERYRADIVIFLGEDVAP